MICIASSEVLTIEFLFSTYKNPRGKTIAIIFLDEKQFFGCFGKGIWHRKQNIYWNKMRDIFNLY